LLNGEQNLLRQTNLLQLPQTWQKHSFFIYSQTKKTNMENQIRRGPKPKPAEEKKVAVIFWVKQKFYYDAKKEANAIERKYDSKKS